VSPAADPGDGAQLLHAVEPDHLAIACAAPAATPLLTTSDVRPSPRVEDPVRVVLLLDLLSDALGVTPHHDVDLVDDADGGFAPFPMEGPDHVTQGLQNTWRPSDVMGTWA
jgi:hypothetical protein